MSSGMANELRRKQKMRRKARRRRRFFMLIFVIIIICGCFFSGRSISRRVRVKEDGVPLLLQTDSRWRDLPYGSSTIGDSGCAPVCLSMVAIAITGNEELTPDKVAALSEENGYYIEGTGTSWELISEGAKKLGLSVKELPLDKNFIIRELENYHPIICSVGPGDFTSEGHFIVLTSTENGVIYIKDPNSSVNSMKEWSYEQIAPQINAMWVCK